MTPSCSEPLRLDSLEEKNCYACWAFYKEQHNVIEKPLPSAQSAVQVATVRGYSGRQDWTARSQAYLPNFSRPDSVVSEPRRSRNTEPKLQHWSARSVHSQWRSTCLKKRHGCDPKAAASPPSSSAVRCLRGPTGVSDDPTSP